VSLRSAKTERIDLGDGDWVEVRLKLSVKQSFAVAELDEKDAEEKTLGLLSILIVAWSDPGPITPEAISELDAEVAEKIMSRFTAIQPARPKASSSRSTGSSKGKARSRGSTP
jgi:hypothetical protein